MSDLSLSAIDLEAKLGASAFAAWQAMHEWLADNYEMEVLWGKGGKKWERELKYRKAGKTLCGFYPADGFFGFLVIFGKEERARIEAARGEFSASALEYYDAATTYHDGKWVMLEVHDTSLLEDAKRMLLIKRKPNKK